MPSYADSLFSGKTQSPFGAAPKVGDQLGIGKGGVMTPEVQASLVKAMETQKAQQAQQAQQNTAPQSALSPEDQALLNKYNQKSTPQTTPQVSENKGILGTIGGVVGDIGRGLLDTALQPARFAERAGKGLGIGLSEMVSGRKYTPEEVAKINNFGGPGLQESVAKVVAPSASSQYNTDSYKTTGEFVGGALQAGANLATPFVGKMPGVIAQGGAYGLGGALERGESLPSAIGSGLMGAGTSALFSKGGSMLGKKFGKTANTIADDIGTTAGKAKPATNVAREKAIDAYENIVGIPKSAAKQEAKLAAGRSAGKDHRQAIGTIVDEGITLKAKNESGRQVFDTVGDIELLNQRRQDVGSQLQAAIESNPKKNFDINIAANRAKIKIRNMKGKLQSEKNKMINEIDDLVQAEKVANGWKPSDKVAMSKSAKFDGGKFNEFKSGLHDKAYKNGVLKQEAEHLNILAGEVNDAVDRVYKNVADVKAIRKQYGDIKNAQDFLIDQNGKVVAGGRIPKLASRALGAAIGMAIPIPLPGVKEYVGSEIGGKAHDFLTNPERLSAKVLNKLSKGDKQSFVGNLRTKLLDAGVPMEKIARIIDSMPELSGVAAGIIMNNQPETTQQGQPAQLGQQQDQLSPEDQALLEKYNQKTAQ